MPSQNNKNSPLVEFKEVSFSYPGSEILKDISFKIFPSEFIGIIGPNGGGKTTLLKLILGFLKPSSGNILIFGEKAGNSWGMSPISYVPQSIRYDRDFPITVEEVVLSGLISQLPWYGRFKSEDKKKAKRALEKVGLTHLKNVPFGTLSGGQSQRVLIARALVSNPQLLLLDEPTASVDSQAESDIYKLLQNLKGDMTILMVTHDLGIAIDQVDRVLCVQGQVISLKPEEVCKHFVFGLYHMPLKQ